MSEPGKFEQGALIFSLIYREQRWLDAFELCVKRKYGNMILKSEEYNFPIEYYYKEMGKDLVRKFLLIEGNFPIGKLVEAKLWAYGFEKQSSVEGKRGINIDPALLFTPSLIIATFKPFSHRVPLSKGVYAHLELLFIKGKPMPLPWTYPDFASKKYDIFLEKAWKTHREKKK